MAIPLHAWKTIPCGGMTKTQLIGDLYDAGFEVAGQVREMLCHPDFKTAGTRTHVQLARAPLSDLGRLIKSSMLEQRICGDGTVDVVKKTVVHEEILSNLGEWNALACPAEVGPHLRLHLEEGEELNGDTCLVLMQPLTIGDWPYAFVVRRSPNGKRWLDTRRVDSIDWFRRLTRNPSHQSMVVVALDAVANAKAQSMAMRAVA